MLFRNGNLGCWGGPLFSTAGDTPRGGGDGEGQRGGGKKIVIGRGGTEKIEGGKKKRGGGVNTRRERGCWKEIHLEGVDTRGGGGGVTLGQPSQKGKRASPGKKKKKSHTTFGGGETRAIERKGRPVRQKKSPRSVQRENRHSSSKEKAPITQKNRGGKRSARERGAVGGRYS